MRAAGFRADGGLCYWGDAAESLQEGGESRLAGRSIDALLTLETKARLYETNPISALPSQGKTGDFVEVKSE